MTYAQAPPASANTGTGLTAPLVECRHCHQASAFVVADTYTCREQCVECGRKTLLSWASYREPVVILGSRRRLNSMPRSSDVRETAS